MWQSAVKRCGLPVSDDGLFEIWLMGSEVNGAGEPESVTETPDGAEMTWREAGLELRACISTDAETGVVRLSGRMKNIGDTPVTLTRANWRFTLAERQYSLYTQAGGWSRENRGGWHDFDAGEMAIGSEWGRTTLSATPFMVLRDETCGRMTAMHLIPCGDWRMSLQNRCDNMAYLRLGAGERLCAEIKSGESRELPEVLFYSAEGIDFSAHKLHAYAVKNMCPDGFSEPYVIYNTWFDEFSALKVEHLREEMHAVRELGGEVFIIDAGWFSDVSDDNWGLQGDWREKPERAFYGRMREFADEVRANGMKFGLWMEAERAERGTPIEREHPEWLVYCTGDTFRLKLECADARKYLIGEMDRLISTYGVEWIKIDSNLTLNPGWDGLYEYTRGWHEVLAEVRRLHPETCFECCSSGAMRMDLNNMSRYDMLFISDNAEPCDVVRISEGAFLRVPPGRIGRWAVVHPTPDLPQHPYGKVHHVLAPEGATWDRARMYDIAFPMAVNLLGQFGLSGDIAGLSNDDKAVIKQAIAVYKQNREHIRRAQCRLLTPPKPFGDKESFSAIQFTDGNWHMLYAFRMSSRVSEYTILPRALEDTAEYTVRQVFPENKSVNMRMTGREIMEQGFTARLMLPETAAIFCMEKA